MDAKTVAEAKADLDTMLETAVTEPVIITREGKPPLVLISLAEWNSWQATLDLTRNPRTNARLREAIATLDRGEGVEVTIEQLDAVTAGSAQARAAE